MGQERRTFVRTLGAGCAGVLAAGCLESAGDDEPTEDATEAEPGTESPSGRETGEDGDNSGDGDNGGDGTANAGLRSSAHHDPADGFADPAPWLDDDTPVYRVTVPTRAAVEDAVGRSGPRVVVFETSGTIDLAGERLTVTNDELYLAGQTAPSPGVTFVRGGVSIEASDCVVQHLRFRPGDAGRDTGWEPDGLNTGDGTENNVIDHCTAGWSVDETLSVGYETTDTTVSNCLITEPLHDATHHKGIHGYGSLIGDGAENVALMGNVWAHATNRNPRLKAETRSVVVNNVMYHFDEATNLGDTAVSSIVGNAYLRVDEGDAVIEGGRAYVEDNVTDPETPVTDGTDLLNDRPLWPGEMEAFPSGDVVRENLANAGARPADRSDHDRRVVENVRNGEGDVVDSQDDVGGYPDLPQNTAELEVPESGLRAWLRERALAVES